MFLDRIQKPFKERVISQFTVFEATYRSAQGYDLSQQPFSKQEKVLLHRSEYGPCQALGSVLRERDIEALICPPEQTMTGCRCRRRTALRLN